MIAILCGSFAMNALLAWARYRSFHNQTFDLALYARMAWGLGRGDFYEPILDAHVAGLHLSAVLAPLGLIAQLLDPALVLILAQSLALALAGWPLARFGARRLGATGALLGAAALSLYPNLGHVATYEVHPGTLALLPLAWAVESADRRALRAFALACAGVVCCREDLAVGLLLLAVTAPWGERRRRLAASGAALLALAVFALFLLVLVPRFAPAHGSLSAHFGRWGDTPVEVVGAWLARPADVFAHLVRAGRISYPFRVLLPLALLPLLGWRWLVPALPALALNLMSDFPTTTHLDSHYLSPTLPFLIAAALEGLRRAQRAAPRLSRDALAVCLALGSLLAGGTPASLDFDASRFADDADSADARRLLAAIPAGVSVQAPDALLPHLAARRLLFRADDRDRGARFIVLDIRHRRRFSHQETLIRTVEEPRVRDWLAKDDVALRVATRAYLLLERGVDPRQGVGLRRVAPGPHDGPGRPVTACLRLLRARVRGRSLYLTWRASGPCPADLALRVDVSAPPRRVDLFADGLYSPRHLRQGDVFETQHRFGRPLRGAIYVGALRQSGARPEPTDPPYLEVPVHGSTSAP